LAALEGCLAASIRLPGRRHTHLPAELVRFRSVLERILEWCADIFGVTVHSKLGQLVGSCFLVLVVGLVLCMRWGAAGCVVPALLLASSVMAARRVEAARREVWRAASDDLGERPARVPRGLVGPTAASLLRLAEAVRAARQARYPEADSLAEEVQRDLLRPEEVQLLDAVRAMVSMGLGATARAAQQAVVALPTGSEDLDTCLGRALVRDAWNDPGRLDAIQRAWEEAGVEGGPLSRLRILVRIRLDAEHLEAVETPEARALSDEARAIGDDELAAELDARSRPAYR
jgi:hypothetical protein